MTPTKGYYSIVQFCPDPSRLEAANVGVVLFVPGLHYLQARMASGNDRIRRFFGGEDADYVQIAALKALIEERLKAERHAFQSVEDLDRLIATRANELQLSPARPMKVLQSPDEELERLFHRLVGGRAHVTPAAPASKRLAEAFRNAHVQDRVYEHVTVQVPVIKRQITVPYGYQNGRFNLITPVRFAKLAPEAVVNRACKFAIEGESLYEARDQRLGEMKLVVVGDFAAHQRDERDVVRVLFRKHNVDLYPMSRVGELIDHIRTTAKPKDPHRGPLV